MWQYFCGCYNAEIIAAGSTTIARASSLTTSALFETAEHLAFTGMEEMEKDVYLSNGGHITFKNKVTIPALTWNRGGDSYKEIFTSDVIADSSSIGLEISGTVPSSTLQLFTSGTSLTTEQTGCFTVTANSNTYTLATDGTIDFSSPTN